MEIDVFRKLSARQWYRVFLVAYGLFYSCFLYKVVEIQIQFLHSKDVPGGIPIWQLLVNALILTIIFVFLLQNKRWGWILMAAGSISEILTGLVALQVLYKYREVLPPDPMEIFLNNGVPVLFVVILWWPAIISFFGISRRDRRRTIVAGIVVGILHILILKWLAF